MLAPELLYQLTRPELDSGLIQVIREGETSAAAGTVSHQSSFIVPLDKVLIVAPCVSIAVPGATQFVSFGGITIFTEPGGNQVQLCHTEKAGVGSAADLRVAVNCHQPIWVPPGGALGASFTFTGGGNPNTVRLRYSGILIPRGNLQQG